MYILNMVSGKKLDMSNGTTKYRDQASNMAFNNRKDTGGGKAQNGMIQTTSRIEIPNWCVQVMLAPSARIVQFPAVKAMVSASFKNGKLLLQMATTCL